MANVRVKGQIQYVGDEDHSYSTVDTTYYCIHRLTNGRPAGVCPPKGVDRDMGGVSGVWRLVLSPRGCLS